MRKINDCWEKNTEEKVVNKKLPDLRGVLRRKSTLYDWGLKKDEEVKSDMKVEKVEVLIK